MMPENMLSTTPVPGDFLYPDNFEYHALRDYEWGGIGLQDPSLGLFVQVWVLSLDGADVVVEAPNTAPTTLFTGDGITELSLAFDHNMNPFVAFVQNGVARYWWFDTLTSNQVLSDLPIGSTNPRAAHDDKRYLERNTSDIILAYVRAGSLYMRMQRERYTIEYELATGVLFPLQKIGMSDKNRLQFQFGPEPVTRGGYCV